MQKDNPFKENNSTNKKYILRKKGLRFQKTELNIYFIE